MGAIRRNANGRNAAEVLVGRTQHEAAAEFEQPELPAGGVANVEARDRLAVKSIATGGAADGDTCASPEMTARSGALAMSAVMVRRFVHVRPQRQRVVRSLTRQASAAGAVRPGIALRTVRRAFRSWRRRVPRHRRW